MNKKGSKKKEKASGVDSDVEIISSARKENKFKDTRAIRGVSPEFKWGNSIR